MPINILIDETVCLQSEKKIRVDTRGEKRERLQRTAEGRISAPLLPTHQHRQTPGEMSDQGLIVTEYYRREKIVPAKCAREFEVKGNR